MNPKDKEGLKKPQMHLIPYRVMVFVASVLLHGATKYGPWNWRKEKIMASQYYSANARHMGAWYEGEDLDPESRLNHVFHAIATLVILADAIIGDTLKDDRPK